MKLKPTILLAALALTASGILATAQDSAPKENAPKDSAPKDNANDRGRQRASSIQDFMQRMNERVKTSLKVTDEEWTVLQPLIEKVQTRQREAMGSRYGGFGGGRRGGDNNNTSSEQPARPGAAEGEALRTALENDSTSADDLKAKLAAVRETRKKSSAELTAAREELQKVVTVRQEAVLVSMGILD